MNWIASHLLLLGALGAILIIGSVLRIGLRKPRWPLPTLGAVIVLVAVAGSAYVAFSPPGREETVPQQPAPGPRPLFPKMALERLRLAWDSESNADWPVAETLAQISESAYLPPVNAQESYRNLGFAKFMPVVAGSMIGYVISTEEVTVIAFRGTDSGEVSDWLANLGVSPTETEHGQLHKSFYDAYESLKPQIMTLLGGRTPKHLWITGHSLGGALALVCAYDLAAIEHIEIDGIVTFGQPMIARKALADYLDSLLLGRYAHFVNEADIVPRVPPSYFPCGSVVWFFDGGIRRSRPKRHLFGATAANDAPEIPEKEITPMSDQEFRQLQAELQATNALPDRLPDGTRVYKSGPPLIDDHSMSMYLEKVRRLVSEPQSP